MERGRPPTRQRVSRRRLLTGVSSVGLGALVTACAGKNAVTTSTGETVALQAVTDADLTALFTGARTCTLTASTTQGPYYFDADKIRSDVREDKQGTKLRLALQVQDSETCKPIPHAVVEIWHCDAGGTYSGVQGDTGMFLRGVQRTDAKGVAAFKTIYPGWCPGRTVHIHTMVHLGGTVVHTGQLYFPDGVTDVVYARAPYNRRPSHTTRNAADSIYRNGGKRSTLRLVRNGSAYVGSITMGVQRS